ncbi:MAG TPA: deoxynucleoside kinase, partial [bacterium]|nr:deoxynucleoside kinase [bacterium]
MLQHKYIAIEGPIGVGKTSLADILAKKLNSRLVLEAAEENPFIAEFYKDIQKHAFQTQMFFLLSRYKQQQDLAQNDLFQQGIVSDYVFAKDRIFANLTLDDNELKLYEQIHSILGGRVLK